MKKEDRYKFIAFFEGIILAVILLTYLISKIPMVIAKISLMNPEFAKMEKKIQSLDFDLARAEDVTNILLAIQDFINEKGEIPDSLQKLNDSGFLTSKNLTDPETGQLYFFKKAENEFIFCVYFSNRIRGVNIDECPISGVFPQLNYPMDKNLTAQIYNQVPYNRSRLIFTVIFTIGVLFFSYIIYFLIKRLFYTI